MDFKKILERLSYAENLTKEEATFAMNQILAGTINSEQIAGFLTALRVKGETIEELTTFVSVMREKAVSVDLDIQGAIDLVGTGGDKSGTFNISTLSAFVVAGAGVPVIKHGNRSASSQCGSADVLERLGAKIELNAKQVQEVYNKVGMVFIFAPAFHPAMRYVMPARKALGFRTFFNIMGPLCNPGRVKRYVIGAFSKEVAQKMAKILANLDTEFAYAFHSHDGLDELSITADADIFQIKDHILSMPISFAPESLGFQRAPMKELMGGGIKENADIFLNVLNNKATDAQRDVILLNASFGIHASGKVESLTEAKLLAEESLKTGKARHIFYNFIEATNSL